MGRVQQSETLAVLAYLGTLADECDEEGIPSQDLGPGARPPTLVADGPDGASNPMSLGF
jgi:hypothetical protein